MSDNPDNPKRKVVVPRVNAYLYRTSKSEERLGKNKGIISKIVMRDVSEMRGMQNRIKGLEHEQTALFGGVLDLNVATDPQNKIFDSIMPDDHVEVFYKDLDQQEDLNFLGLPSTYMEPTRDEGPPEEDPKFAGLAWKGELIEKPSQVTTKIKAWDYHRMMQYMNIPRGDSGITSVKYLELDPFSRARDSAGDITVQSDGTESIDIKPHNDLLDYIDHVIELYMRHGHEEDSVFFFPTVQGPQEGEAKVVTTLTRDVNPLGVKAFTFSGLTSGANPRPAIKPESMWDDYPFLKESGRIGKDNDNPFTFNSETLEDVLKKIRDAPAGGESPTELSITRFIDTTVHITTSFTSDPSPVPDGPLYRVTADIIVVNQFALAQLMAAGMTYDYGISEWFTPVVLFGTDYKAAMAAAHRSAAEEGGVDADVTTSRLVYVRWRAGFAGPHLERRKPSDQVKMERVAVYNLDSFGNLVDYFSRAININLQAIHSFHIKDASVTSTASFMKEPHFMPIVLASVDFPQKKSSRGTGTYPFYRPVGRDGGYLYAELIGPITDGIEIGLGGTEGSAFRALMQYHLRNITQWTNLMSTSFELDDKLISFMTNIPSSYMRADIFTGSKFKTYSYDSLSIIRVIQILSSTMRGFPATNNPIHSGQQAVPEGAKEKAIKVDHYPIFLANRIVVKSKILWVPERNIKDLPDTDRIREYKGYSSVSWAFKEHHTAVTGRLMIVLDVNFKAQVYDEKKVEFKIPLGDINDLSMVKGSAISHYLTMAFGKNHEEWLRRLDLFGVLSDAKISMSFNLGGKTFRSVSPAQFSPLTWSDMTQQQRYDPLIARSNANTVLEVLDETDGIGGFPVYHAGVAYTALKGVGSNDFAKGHYMISDFVTRKTFKRTNGDIRLDENSDKDFQEVLVSVENYINFSDIINEIKLLKRLADPTAVTAAYVGLEDSTKGLFENISLVMPYKLALRVVDGFNTFRLVPLEDDDDKDISLKDFFEDPVMAEFLKLEKEDMAWMVPLRGHILIYDDTVFAEIAGLGRLKGMGVLEEVEFEAFRNNSVFDRYRPMYLVISFLDLIIKGLRYMLWNISKSRFIGHVYLPINYAGYKNLDTTRSNIDLSPGSSILFHIEDANVRAKTIQAGAVLPMLLGRTPDEVIIQGQDQHQLQSIQVDGQTGSKSTLIWYVSKKIVYIGEDSGAMMRLNMTEGSFDWTVFYREDTQMTRMSEYFLMNGMGSFFLGRAGT